MIWGWGFRFFRRVAVTCRHDGRMTCEACGGEVTRSGADPARVFLSCSVCRLEYARYLDQGMTEADAFTRLVAVQSAPDPFADLG